MRFGSRHLLSAGMVTLVAALALGPMGTLRVTTRAGALDAPGSLPRAAVTLAGAGSTFVAPVMTGQWIPGYTARHPRVQIGYAAIGSGKGLTTWTQGHADFAASDALLKASQEASARARCGAGVIKIPVTISAVAIIFNVPGVKVGLKLSPTVLANIFLGKITSWNDPAIQATNPGVALPNLGLQVVHRSDGSGTTYIVTTYLSAVSPQWKSSLGAGTTVNWPTGTGVKGSGGIVQGVATTLGAISYVDLAYAIQDNLDYVTMQNASGHFVAPGVDAASAAADSFAALMPPDLQQLIVNSPAPDAYPITGYSYIFMCARQPGAKGRVLVDFAHYIVSAGQARVKSLAYAPLPPSVQRRDTAALGRVATR